MAQLQLRDQLLEKIQTAKEQSNVIANTLDKIRYNEQQFASSCNKRQEYDALLNNLAKLHLCNQKAPGFEAALRQNFASLEGNMRQNILTVQTSMDHFREVVTTKMSLLTNAVEELATEKIALWKHEKQRSAIGVPVCHTITLEQLQFYCIPIADLIWDLYQQFQEAGRILQNGVIQTGNPNDLPFVQKGTEDVIRLIQHFLSHALVVEEQPQIIGTKTKFRVILSLLTGKGFNIPMNPPEVLVRIINEEQARQLLTTDITDNAGDIINNGGNAKVSMAYREESNKLTASFNNLQVTRIRRKNGGTNESVTDEKYCLHFAFTLNFRSLFNSQPVIVKVSSISLPMTAKTHGSQEASAAGTISWDYAFASMWREPFDVPQTAKWSGVAEVLKAKYREATEGHELTEENLAYLARKAFRSVEPHPETISFDSFCNDKSHPGVSFSFWTWFHGILKFIDNGKTNLKEMCRAGLVMGFIDRNSAEALVSNGKPGTFLLRYSESFLGTITITFSYTKRPGRVGSLGPFKAKQLESKKLAMLIKEVNSLQWLYQTPECTPKDVALERFYDPEEPVPVVQDPQGASRREYIGITHTVLEDSVLVPVSNGGDLAHGQGSSHGAVQSPQPPQEPLPSMHLYRDQFYGQFTHPSPSSPSPLLSHIPGSPQPETWHELQPARVVRGGTSNTLSTEITFSSMETDYHPGSNNIVQNLGGNRDTEVPPQANYGTPFFNGIGQPAHDMPMMMMTNDVDFHVQSPNENGPFALPLIDGMRMGEDTLGAFMHS